MDLIHSQERAPTPYCLISDFPTLLISHRLLYLLPLCVAYLAPYSDTDAGDFCGFISNYGLDKNIMRFVMLMLSCCQLLSRAFGYALIEEASSKRYVASLIFGELCLYLLYKVVRGDFYYWWNSKGMFRFLLPLIARVSIKILSNFTAMIQLRLVTLILVLSFEWYRS